MQNMREQFFDLAHYANDFRAALTLFDFCHEQFHKPGNERCADLPYDHLRFVAARDGAMSIYHFGITIEAIRSQIGKCPTLFSKLDRAKLKALGKHLRAEFPYFEAVRHAAAHLAELTETAENREANAVTGPHTFAGVTIEFGAKVTFRNVLVDRQYANTTDGKIQAYEVSRHTYDALVAIRVECYSVFEPVAES
jgi:hypothetical protein